jgi:phosphatidate cytidylyltransferase
MKTSELSNGVLRFISGAVMLLALIGIIALQAWFPSFHVVRWVGVLIMIGAIYEMIKCLRTAGVNVFNKYAGYFAVYMLLLMLMLVSVYFVGAHPWIMLWLLMIIVGADIGAWLSGKLLGGDKMWERLSANKTWAGQIGGIVFGTFMSVLFFMYVRPFGEDALFAVLFGCTISLLSQYGDLSASFIKRCLGIKDFSNLLPGHGGIMDRFDGWIYVLPFVWFFI